MNKIVNLDNTFTCRAYSPQTRPLTAYVNSTRIRYNSTKNKIVQGAIMSKTCQGNRLDRSVLGKSKQKKMYCDVACSTRETFLMHAAKAESPKLVSKIFKNTSNLTFTKLSMPSVENTALSLFTLNTTRKPHSVKIPKARWLVGMLYRESLKSTRKLKKKKH